MVYFAIPSIGKPELQLSDLAGGPATRAAYDAREGRALMLFYGVTLATQFLLSVLYVLAKCGGSLDKNIGPVALMTILPWGILFGATLLALRTWPGFKSALSDVVGYAVVAAPMSALLGDVLLNPEIEGLPQQSRQAADALVKMVGDKSMLVNQFNPSNFEAMWSMLAPLMQPMAATPERKQQLLDLVVRRDNVGEALWYVYAAVVISSLVFYNLAARGCTKSAAQLKADHEAYVAAQVAAADGAKAAAQGSTYSMN
jgi:hypothetical protein